MNSNENYDDLLTNAILNDDSDTVTSIHTKSDGKYITCSKFITLAAVHRNWKILNILFNFGYAISSYTFTSLCNEMTVESDEECAKLITVLKDYAIRLGNIPCNISAFRSAQQKECMQTFTALQEAFPDVYHQYIEDALYAAALRDDVNAIKKIHKDTSGELRRDPIYVDLAASEGNMNALKFLKTHRYAASHMAYTWVARGIYKKFNTNEAAVDEDKNKAAEEPLINLSINTKLHVRGDKLGMTVMQWLHKHYHTISCTTDAFYNSDICNTPIIKSFLIEKFPEIYDEHLRVGIFAFSQKLLNDKLDNTAQLELVQNQWNKLTAKEKEDARSKYLIGNTVNDVQNVSFYPSKFINAVAGFTKIQYS